jgi:hypothetical protein
MCECSDAQCRELVTLALEAYEAIRADARRFFVVRGHESREQDADVVAVHESYVVVEKRGETGRIAAELAGEDETAAV